MNEGDLQYNISRPLNLKLHFVQQKFVCVKTPVLL